MSNLLQGTRIRTGGARPLAEVDLPIDRCHRCVNNQGEPSRGYMVERDNCGIEEWRCRSCGISWYRYRDGEVRRPDPKRIEREETYTCTRCTLTKPASEFRSNGAMVHAHGLICKACWRKAERGGRQAGSYAPTINHP
jgi:hypothetical protein